MGSDAHTLRTDGAVSKSLAQRTLALLWPPTAAAPAERHEPYSEDVALMRRVAAGDRTAVAEAYRAHHAPLRAFAQRVTGDHALAEDLVHDVFVRLPDLARTYQGRSRLETFLIGVAARLCHRQIRAAVRQRAALVRLRSHQSATSAPTASACPLDLEPLYRALDRLPLAQRTAFVLCEVEERSAEEVALALGVPVSTVRTRCFHARRKLRDSLEKSLSQESRGVP